MNNSNGRTFNLKNGVARRRERDVYIIPQPPYDALDQATYLVYDAVADKPYYFETYQEAFEKFKQIKLQFRKANLI